MPASIPLELQTPALLFPAVSLLLLAYTNRFVTLANLIRQLHQEYHDNPPDAAASRRIMAQIRNLRRRLELIKQMQTAGIASIFFCVLCMITLFAGWEGASKLIFVLSLLLMLLSMALSLAEIRISIHALNLHISDLESDTPAQRPS